MTYSIVYSSNSGNTALLAARILKKIPKKELIYCGAPDPKAYEADVIFIGFWVNHGNANEKTCTFLKGIRKQKVFIFGTAGYGGSEDYFREILARIETQLTADAELIGKYMCRGKIPFETGLKYRTALLHQPNDLTIMKLIDGFDKSSNHPNEEDLNRLDFEVLKAIETQI